MEPGELFKKCVPGLLNPQLQSKKQGEKIIKKPITQVFRESIDQFLSYPQQQQLSYNMNYIQINYQTWEREQCYGLFDYSEVKGNSLNQKITINSSGTLLRNQINFQLEYLATKDKKKKTKGENLIPLLSIDQSEGHFFVNDIQNGDDRQPLSLIVPRKETGYRLKEGDKVRLGKASLEVLRIFWKPNKGKNHYEQIEPKVAERQSIFACSFYSQQDKASMLDTNPACRFCYSRTIDQHNPFLAVCDCAGSAKYIHEECLIEWIKKRSGISEHSQEGVYYAYAKAFTCEVCHALYRLDRLVRRVFGAREEELQEYVALRLNCDPAIVFVVDLGALKEIHVGRSLESTIVVNELSVSRRHCMARVDPERKTLTLVDLHAKFGTVVQVERAKIDGQEEYQKGRTKLHFARHRKMSFFERIGFCSPVENFRDQHRD